jgi:hypothetical protein
LLYSGGPRRVALVLSIICLPDRTRLRFDNVVSGERLAQYTDGTDFLCTSRVGRRIKLLTESNPLSESQGMPNP